LTDATDLDRRAWHLAGAAAATDATAADALADAAERALRRGGAVSAARAWEQSARLTPEPETAGARLLRSGIAYWDGSMVPHALEVLDEVIERTDDRLVRADAASAWGEARAWEQDVAAGTRLLVDEAFAIEPHDPGRASVMFMRAAVLAQ